MKFAVILSDCPWSFATYSGPAVPSRTADPYPVMKLADIAALPVRSIAADNCVLLHWVTWPLLKEGIAVAEGWGFNYKTVAFVWAKTTTTNKPWHMGLGYWTRSNTEVCLLFTRGNPKRIGKGIRQLVVAPVTRHSQKPFSIYDSIEGLLDGPYCELFARLTRPGWVALGNEIDGADIRDSLPALALSTATLAA